MEIITAKNVIAYIGQPDSLDMEVAFAHLPDQFVTFTARPDDSAEHGRELYERAMAGEFGDVVALPPLTPYEIARRDNPGRRQQCLSQASDMARHWDMMGDSSQANAWRDYYRTVYALALQKSWPMVNQWPSAPKSEVPLW